MSGIRPIPEGFHTVTPHLVVNGAAAAIEFYREAFEAVETHRMPGPGGKLLHAQVRIGDSPVMLSDEFPSMGATGPAGGGSPVVLHLYVDDADEAYRRAIDAGAKPIMPPETMFWGDRYARIEDPFGHHWSIATHVEDLTPAQIMERAPTVGP